MGAPNSGAGVGAVGEMELAFVSLGHAGDALPTIAVSSLPRATAAVAVLVVVLMGTSWSIYAE